MSFKIVTPSAAHLSPADIGAQPAATSAAAGAASGNADDDKRTKDAAKVGRDFEAILVRQMLTQTKVAGKGGYADMAVESLATSITAAGGLGMGKAIEQSLLASGHGAHTPAPGSAPTGTLAPPAGTPISLPPPPSNTPILLDKIKPLKK